ncbi:hypothetical protein SUGI_1027490 [Cryptomeria japonica]|uniref:uncharacterized protein LOC131078945 isoform X1 n=1 Tax=Cryptomeria japonica TaxID=3369 RepID=UPI0024146FA3|nr:uncharacterized protein LOC131078945 isoform X1 [Cryptomeria japonica]GLJ48722.1 hypothetical protein SUGI_1027490 [Cryptomeria japonica]
MEEETACIANGSEYYLPALDFHVPPQRLYHFHHQFKLPSTRNANFLKAVKWSPDGSCFLTSSDDNTLRLFDLPDYGSGGALGSGLSFPEDDSFTSRLSIDEGESIYDYCWYPHMLASDQASCVFASTSRDHPVHLLDSVSGQIRCTYRAYDSMDEITTAFSVAFNPSGTKLFCGYNKVLRVFDIHRPGREFEQYSTLTSTKDGQTGILSCLSFSPAHNGLLAAGSYNRTTALFAEDNAELLFVLHGQEGGVTQVLFSRDGNYLYTGGRKDPYVLCWDVRNTAGILYKLYRSAENTNQRIAFDIEPYGRHLGTGGQDGRVNVYDLQTGEWVTNFQASFDTVNGFCFHPSLPLAVSSSGHRRFCMPEDDEEHLDVHVEENCASVWNFSCTWIGYGSDGNHHDNTKDDASTDASIQGNSRDSEPVEMENAI